MKRMLDFFNLGGFSLWLQAHETVAHIILFVGMYFESLIGTNFFLPGEIFLLAGSTLAGIGGLYLPVVVVALYGGAMLGDSSSYWIGRKAGPSVFKEGRAVLNPKNYVRGEALFRKHGKKAIFLARLIGPFNLVTPFLAGIYRVSYRDFLLYNLPGIFIGVGQFIIVGYFFGAHFETALVVFRRYFFVMLGVIFAVLVVRWYLKSEKREP